VSSPTDTLHFTDQEKRILAALADGGWHPKAELVACLDEYTSCATLRVHLFNIRAKLERRSQTVQHKAGAYRHVRIVRYDE